jgi:glycosyltransferase involved in cell wall biosynthesis
MLAVEDELRKLGCELTWLAPESGPLAEELQRLHRRHLPFSIRNDGGRLLSETAALTTLRARLLTLQPDLIHGNSLAIARWLGRHADELQLPATCHIRDIVGLSRTAVADLNRNRALIAVSHATKDFHVSQGVDANRVSVVYNGIEVEPFNTPDATGIDLREQLGLPSDAFLVAAIGQIGLRKGQTIYAEAAVAALQSAGEERRPMHFLLIGERHSDKEESRVFDAQIDAIITAANREPRFHRLGYRVDVPAILRQVDVVIHAARQEPLGRVLLEAAAAGRAIIATDVGGTREILSAEISALLVSPNDPGAIAAALLQLARDSELRQRLGAKAQETVKERFTLRQCAQGCLDVWRSAVESDG